MGEWVSMVSEPDEVVDMARLVEEMLEWLMEVPVETGGQTSWDGAWTSSDKLLADSTSSEVETDIGTYSELAASMLA